MENRYIYSVYDPTHDFKVKEVWRTGIYIVFMILHMTSRAKKYGEQVYI